MASQPTDHSGERRDISSLYSFMPDAVQSRFSAFPSFRQSLRNASNRQSSTTQSEPELTSFNRPRAQADEDANVSVDGLNEASTRGRQFMSFGKAGGLRGLHTPSFLALPSGHESETPSSTQTTLQWASEERESGVEWDTAETALLLLKRACESADRDGSRLHNTRALIVDANKYLLRSLPTNISRQELVEIEDALLTRLNGSNRPFYNRPTDHAPLTLDNPDPHSWLRRAIAFLIIQTSLLIAFIIPYIILLTTSLYRLERQHQVTERLLIRGLDVTGVVGERGLEMRDAAARFGQRRVAVSLVQMGGWFVKSIVGGVSDGAGKGVGVVGDAVMPRLVGTLGIDGVV